MHPASFEHDIPEAGVVAFTILEYGVLNDPDDDLIL